MMGFVKSDRKPKEEFEEKIADVEGIGCERQLSAFTAAFSAASLVTQALTAFLASQLTTLEKVYGLNSAQSGFIASANDLGFLLTVLIFSHFGKRWHIPRILAITTITYGVAAFISSSPHFIFGVNDYFEQNGSTFGNTDKLCSSELLDSNAADLECALEGAAVSATDRRTAYAIIVIGMVIQGMAKSPRSPLSTAYIDNNVRSQSRTGAYIGVISAMTIFGPGLAFVLGGVLSNMYITLEETRLSPTDPRWLGAWWLGFVIFGSLALIMGIPLVFFPREIIKNKSTINTNDTSSDTTGDTSKHGCDNRFFANIKEFFSAILELFRNVVYIMTVISSCALIFNIAGIVAFLPKYIESQYAVTSSMANFMMGGILVVANCLGTVGGGIIITRFKFGLTECLRMCAICMFLSGGLDCLGFVFGCEQPLVNGLQNTSVSAYNSSCSSRCDCGDLGYLPVCGANGVNYFSPCYAGCTSKNDTTRVQTGCIVESCASVLCALPIAVVREGLIKSFNNCACVPKMTADPGLCESDCSFMIPFDAMVAASASVGLLCMTPLIVIQIRSVAKENKALAIGMTSFFTTVFGWLPAPVVYGLIFDSSCSLWNYPCGERGSCAIYDLVDIRTKFTSMNVALRLSGSFFMTIALIYNVVKRRKLSNKLEENGEMLQIQNM